MARAAACPPPHKPYIDPDYSVRRGMRRVSLHVNALNAWRSRAWRIDGAETNSLQMRTNNHFRFIIAADICNSSVPVGGWRRNFRTSMRFHRSGQRKTLRTRRYIAPKPADSSRIRRVADWKSTPPPPYLSETKVDIAKLIPRDNLAQSAFQTRPFRPDLKGGNKHHRNGGGAHIGRGAREKDRRELEEHRRVIPRAGQVRLAAYRVIRVGEMMTIAFVTIFEYRTCPFVIEELFRFVARF